MTLQTKVPTTSDDRRRIREVCYVSDDEIKVQTTLDNSSQSGDQDDSYPYRFDIDMDDSLPCASTIAGTQHNKRDPTLRPPKKNRLIKAMKSLQCSPRVVCTSGGAARDRSDRAELLLEENNFNDQRTRHIQYRSPNVVWFEEPRHSKSNRNASVPQDPENPSDFANFANFDSVQDEFEEPSNPIAVPVTPSISATLELDKVLANLDRSDDGYNQHLSTDSRQQRGLQQYQRIEIFTDNVVDDEDDDRNPYPLETDSSKLMSTTPGDVQNEFSIFSQDATDTPITCNKSSIVLTPKGLATNSIPDMEEPSPLSSHWSGQQNSVEHDENMYGKPPKRILHKSLSLGDALSPSGDDEYVPSPQKFYHGRLHRLDSNENLQPGALTDTRANNDGTTDRRNDSLAQAQSTMSILQDLQIPTMLSNNERSNQRNGKLTKKKVSSSNDDFSRRSSSPVSSFVFSGTEFDPSPNNSINGDSSRRSYYEGGRHERGCEKIISPSQHESFQYPRCAFFWKTHPGVTIRSYRFQQPK